MTVYYVMTDGINDGTRVSGGYATRQTTNFATLGTANYYASIGDVLSGNTMADLDEIVCANTHDFDYGEQKTLLFTHNIIVYSVLFTDLTTNQAGALEKAITGAFDIIIYALPDKKVNMTGINLSVDDDIVLSFLANSTVEISESDFTITGSGSAERVTSTTDGSIVYLNDVNIKFGAIGHGMLASNGTTVIMNGGSIDYNALVPESVLYLNGNAGATVKYENVDFSLITTGIFLNTITTIHDKLTLEFKRCKKTAGLVIFDGNLPAENQTIDAWSIDAGDGYHYFESHRYEGKVSESTQVKRTGGATYDGTNGFSAEFKPSSNVIEFVRPLKFMLKAPELDLTGAGGTTLTTHILLQDSAGTPVSLTDMNCVLKAVYPDSTDLALGKTVSSTTKDLLDTPADLSTETLSFTGTSGTTKQHTIAVTIPQNVSMSKASCELWLELSVDLAATTEMFVCPDPTVS